MTQVLDDPAERARLKAHDPMLLITRRTEIGNEVTETYALNKVHEYDRMVAVVDPLDSITNGESNEQRQAKSLSLAEVAEEVYGSRDDFYTSRAGRALKFDGPVNPMLSDGAVVENDGTLVYKTASLADFARIMAETDKRTVEGVQRAVDSKLKAYNKTVALLERRNPAVASITKESRQTIFDHLAARMPASLRAIEPPKARR